MKQAIHIFRKDIRHLWLRVLLVLLLMAANVVIQLRSQTGLPMTDYRVSSISNLLGLMLPISIWFLLAFAIYQEAIPGDRQFWLTRPYSRFSMLVSKLLFAFACVTIPLFLCDCLILGMQGFSVIAVMPAIVSRQMALSGWVILPSLLLASVTSGLAQFVMAWFVVVLTLFFEIMVLTGGGDAMLSVNLSLSPIILVATSAGIIIWQYLVRRTGTARLALVALICYPIPFILGLGRQPNTDPMNAKPLHPDDPRIEISYLLNGGSPAVGTVRPSPGFFVTASIPLLVRELPPRALLRGAGWTKFLADGVPWPSSDQRYASTIDRIGDNYWQHISIDSRQIAFLSTHEVSLESVFDLEVVNDQVEQRIPVSQQSFIVSGVWHCRVSPLILRNTLACREGMDDSVETTVLLDSGEGAAKALGALPANGPRLGFTPTSDVTIPGVPDLQPGGAFGFIPRRKLVQFHRAISLQRVALANYIGRAQIQNGER